MSFLRPKVTVPPPPPPPPPPPAAVIRPGVAVEAAKKEAAKPRASRKTSVKTGPQGLLDEAPVAKASLLGSAKKET